MHVTWEELGLGGATDQLDIYDVLRQVVINATEGVGVGSYVANVPSHDVAFVIISSPNGSDSAVV